MMTKQKVCLVAVDIRSSHNVGSFFRTCDGFSAEIILTGITPRPLGGDNDNRLPHIAVKADKTIAKTALGAEQTVMWRYFTSLRDAVNSLKAENYKLIAIEQAINSKNLAKINETYSNDNLALFVGPEVTGLSKDDMELFDDVYEIPMTGKKESFNVSIAAAIALYQVRQP